jgi:hypothetical protein
LPWNRAPELLTAPGSRASFCELRPISVVAPSNAAAQDASDGCRPDEPGGAQRNSISLGVAACCIGQDRQHAVTTGMQGLHIFVRKSETAFFQFNAIEYSWLT